MSSSGLATSTSFVVPLSRVGAGDVSLAGGKGANLGELVRAGFAVPAGFVVTTRLYAEALRSAGLDPITVEAAGLESAIVALEVPARLAAPIVEAYHDLGGGPVAVRSSATAEDLPGAAFAGQQETSLNVVGPDALLDAVRSCWASLWGERAVAYRQQLGYAGVPEIAVVVQRMVPSEHAGVMFTADPVTGARDRVVIEASPGLGEAVVSGLVTPEHVVVDGRGRIVQRRPGDEAATGLRADVLVDLGSTGRAIAEHFGRPQDIEWAYAGGTTWVVQARPLTALPPAPIRANAVRRASGAICLELLPTRPYPLDLTAWTVPGWFSILVRMAEEIAGVRLEVERMLPTVDGVLTELRPPEPRLTWRTLAAPWRFWARLRFDPARWTGDPRFVAYERRLEELRRRDLRTSTWSELLAIPTAALDLLNAFVDLRIDYLPSAVAHLARLNLLLALLGSSSERWPLLAGAATRTRAGNDALSDIAAQVCRRSAWVEAFGSSTDDDLVAAVWHTEPYQPLRDALQIWLDAYGHRETTSAALVSAPTWADEPGLLLGNLRALVTRRTGDEHAHDADQAAAAMQRVRGRRLVRLTHAADRVSRAADAARSAMAFREDSHFHALRVRPVLRAALLEAGERLTGAGVLAHRDEVFHLELDELRALGDPWHLDREETDRVRELVRRRAARRAELGNAPLISPATLNRGLGRPATGALVSGTPGGGGRATGVVRVIREPGEFARLGPGEILVCPYTNPAWTTLFASAAAVVADAGSFGSHAAIVAREYGIPAVMGTGNGTRVLSDGQPVVVDGDRGTVMADPTGDERG